MRTRLLQFVLFLSACFFLIAAAAQFNNKKFITYTTEHGLTDNYVIKIISDKKGFVWVATRNGISRFDGLRFTNYTVDKPASNGLRSSWITDLVVDNRGLLWVSTEWGLCYFDESSDKFRYVNKQNDFVVLYKGPLLLQGDNLWMAAENGLKKINAVTKAVATTSLANIPDPQCMTSNGQQIWIGTRGHGFYIFDTNTGNWQIIRFAVLPPDAHLMDFYKEADTLWCATSEGLLKIFNTKTAVLFKKPPVVGQAPVEALTFVTPFLSLTGDSVLLCGTYDNRIALFNKRQKAFMQVFTSSAAQMHGFPASPLHDAEVANQILWIGSDKGLTMLNLKSQDYASYLLKGLGNTDEKVLVKKVLPHSSNDKLWLLINQPAAVALYNKLTNQVERVWKSPETNRRYKTMLSRENNRFVLLHEKGIDEFTFAQGIKSLYSTQERSLFDGAFDQAGNLWLGTDDGLMQYEWKSRQASYFPCNFKGTEVENQSFLMPFFSKSICPDNQGRIWLTSLKYGLFSFNTATKTFTPYRQVSGKPYETKNRCNDLQFDRKGRLWIGNTAGLTCFDTATKTFTNYSQTDGLQSSYLYALSVDENNTVIGRGNAGVFCFDPDRKKFRNYSVPIQMSSALLEQDISIVAKDAIVGFEGGFTVYLAAKSTGPIDLPVYITNFQLRQKKLLTSPEQAGLIPIDLNYNQNVLQIDFAAVNFDMPQEITYRYRLGGGSDEWIDAGTQRSVAYTELSPGNYTFSVVAIGPEGSVSANPAVIRFTIHPPFWERSWFLVMLAVGMAFGIWQIHKWRIRNLHRQQKLKLERQQLEIEAYRQRLELEQISSFFSGSLLNKRTTQEVLNSLAKDLIGHLGFENCMIYLWDEERELLIQQGGYGVKGAIDDLPDVEKYHLQKNRGIVGATVASGEAILLNDTSLDPRYISADQIISGSELCVPLVSNNKILGAINIEQSQKNFFTQHHLQIVSTIAALVASRIEAIQLTAARHQKELELEAAARKITETELAMLRSQMNPHFIFNSLNSIQKYIWESRQEDAAEYLTKFARLMRSILENSEQKFVSLQKELSLLKLYVELEHRRSNQGFDYTITVDPAIEITNTMVPPLLLQPFIENAIWHGLNPKGSQGELSIEVNRVDGKLVCLIDDNGVGRKVSRQLREEKHKSMGITISNQRVELLKKQTHSEAEVQVVDKEAEDGSASGTRVMITLPLIEEYAKLHDS